MTTAAEKFAAIADAFAEGRTVYVHTATRTTKITAKLAAQWTAAGRPVLKLSTAGTSLLMASGKHYVCADYASITTTEAR